MEKTKLGSLLFTIGLVGGGLYGAKKGKPAMTIGLFAIGFGVGGYLLGNSISKFYETN